MANMTNETLSQCEQDVLGRFGNWDVMEKYPAYMAPLNITLSVVSFVVLGVPLIGMAVNRDLWPVCLKPFELVVLQAIGTSFVVTLSFVRDAMDRYWYSCDLLLFTFGLFMPLLLGSQLVMLSQMYNRIVLAKAMQSFKYSEDVDTQLDDLVQKVKAAGRLNNLKVMAFMLSVPVVYVIVSFVYQPFYGAGCVGCKRDPGAEVLFAAFALFSIGYAIFFLHKLREFEDPVGLRHEAQGVLLVFSLAAVAYVAFAFLEPWKLSFEGYANNTWWVVASGFYAHYVNCIRPFYLSIADRKRALAYRRRRKKPVRNKVTTLGDSTAAISGDDVFSLEDVLETKQGIQAFQIHLANEFSLEVLLFWKAAQEWRDMFTTAPTEQAREAVACNIFVAFVPDGAPMQVNISSSEKKRLVDLFTTRKDEPKPPDVFATAVREVFNVMRQDNFERFRQTEAFENLRTLNRHLSLSDADQDNIVAAV
ncbi:Regulator of G-protein signaling loco (RGS) (Locomotion defects protein) (Loco) [Durusdinium trenchii]|uniref:Regulator of G-protein signaling loco (RGS) (Locomotion defects protein) (Loco) n=1 Tax=Durusdinium trenchii TaxID=1381693 RepID=A0ABP0K122_9DINO